MRATLALLAPLPLITACGPAQVQLPAAVDLGVDDGAARLVLIGDSGIFDEAGGPCDATTKADHIPSPCRDALFASIAAEQADAVLDLGDLVYEEGPLCPSGELTGTGRERMERLLGQVVDGTGTPLVLAIGNHDVHQVVGGHKVAEDCYRAYASEREGVHFPERNFLVEAGPLTVAVLDTNRNLDASLASSIERGLDGRAGWIAYAAHHVWRTYGDKDGQDHGPRWSEQIGRNPDLWLNGHAHFLQFGVYDGVAAVTSGASGKLRDRAECPAPPCENDGQLFGLSRYGYAVLDATADRVSVVFKDVTGEPLFAWGRNQGEEGAVVELTELR